MAKLPRVYQEPFGSTAGADDIGQFGSLAAGTPTTTTDVETMMALSNFHEGWLGAVVGNNSPAIEDMNALFFILFYQLRYLFQAGVAEWDTDTVYYIGDLARSDGVVYKSLTDANTGNAVTDSTNWAVLGNNVLAKTVADTGYAAQDGDVLLWDLSGGDSTMTLPAPTIRGQKIVARKKPTDTSTGKLTATPVSGLVNGVANDVITDPGESRAWVADGTGWWAI